jgi:hypothetical protein
VVEHRHPLEVEKQTSVVEELHHPLQLVLVVLEGLLEGPLKGQEERAGGAGGIAVATVGLELRGRLVICCSRTSSNTLDSTLRLLIR